MQKYELMFILPPDLGEEGTAKTVKEIHKIIEEEKGEVVEEDLWGIRDFEYRIKKEEEGFYGVLIFSSETVKIAEIEKALKLHQKVLRFLISKLSENYELKKYSEYLKEWELEDKKEEEEKKEKEEKKREKRKPMKKVSAAATKAPAATAVKKETPKKAEKEEPIAEKETAEVNKEEQKAEKPAKTEKAEEKTDMDDKLKSIIDDPDISL